MGCWYRCCASSLNCVPLLFPTVTCCSFAEGASSRGCCPYKIIFLLAVEWTDSVVKKHSVWRERRKKKGWNRASTGWFKLLKCFVAWILAFGGVCKGHLAEHPRLAWLAKPQKMRWLAMSVPLSLFANFHPCVFEPLRAIQPLQQIIWLCLLCGLCCDKEVGRRVVVRHAVVPWISSHLFIPVGCETDMHVFWHTFFSSILCSLLLPDLFPLSSFSSSIHLPEPLRFACENNTLLRSAAQRSSASPPRLSSVSFFHPHSKRTSRAPNRAWTLKYTFPTYSCDCHLHTFTLIRNAPQQCMTLSRSTQSSRSCHITLCPSLPKVKNGSCYVQSAVWTRLNQYSILTYRWQAIRGNILWNSASILGAGASW